MSNKKAILNLLRGLFFVCVFTAAVGLAINVYLVGQASSGVSGTEFIALALSPLFHIMPYATLAGLILGIGNLIIYRKGRISVLILILTIALTMLLAWTINSSRESEAVVRESSRIMSIEETVSKIENCEIESFFLVGEKVTVSYSENYDSSGEWIWQPGNAEPAGYEQYENAAKSSESKCGLIAYGTDTGPDVSWVSIRDATELLQNCEIKTFSYTSGASGSDIQAEGNRSGIKLTDHGYVKHIYVEQDQEPIMIPLARDAQQQCNGAPQFWYNGRYEQKIPGS